MAQDKYEALKLDNQLCFPLYACARAIVKQYKPFLDGIDLTYTQYITMMVMWEHRQITSKALGDRLFLDSGTLTPLRKKLEASPDASQLIQTHVGIGYRMIRAADN